MGNTIPSGHCRIRNINGTSKHKCHECGSWKQHYINKGKIYNLSWPKKCACYDCDNRATDGAHIQFKNDTDRYDSTICGTDKVTA